MQDMPLDALPRRDLREKAVRRFEKYIARGLRESYVIDPFKELCLKPSTFINRFREAMRGFKVFAYKSHYFETTALFHTIKLTETASGLVIITNTAQLANDVIAQAKPLDAATDLSRIPQIAEDIYFGRRGDTFVRYATDTDRDAVINAATKRYEIDTTVQRLGLLRLSVWYPHDPNLPIMSGPLPDGV